MLSLMNLFQPKIRIAASGNLKPGNVLIAQEFWGDELLHRSVVLLLEHDETGSTGIILNKSSISLGETNSAQKENLLYGGTYDSHRVGFILQKEDHSNRTIRISDEIYYCDKTPCSQNKYTKAFAGLTVWKAGELEKEIEERKWWIDTFKINELYEAVNMDLWEYKLLMSGNLYGLFYDLPDPGIN
jgi:putative transcriptional regulator